LQRPDERRIAFRANMATLARSFAGEAASPLEGMDPAALAEAVRAGLASGLFDDGEWLASAAVDAALYELAAALPSGNEKRELGRRVVARLYDGSAQTFVALATRMALASGKGLAGEPVRARLALSFSLPSAAAVNLDPLAFALLSRRELAREWIGAHATGSLADRRLSGRILEHGSRALARRSALGEESALRALKVEGVQMAFERLLHDREPLVWRHVAVARGLLAACAPRYAKEIDRSLMPDLTPTEWRRGATSLAASASVLPDQALRKVRDLLGKGFLTRDPGAASALLFGVPAAAELEPEAAAELLEMVVARASASALEVMPEILAMLPDPAIASRAVLIAQDTLQRRQQEADSDDGAVALRVQLMDDLAQEAQGETVLGAVRRAQRAYAETGAREAHAIGLEALELVKAGVETLQALDETRGGATAERITRRTSFSTLRDIDTGALEDGTLRDLLVLGGRAESAQRSLASLEDQCERVTEWVVRFEASPGDPAGPVPHPTLRVRRIAALLHLADVRALEEGDESPASRVARARCLRIASLALRHLVAGPSAVLHRVLCACFARATDALLRDGTSDAADVLMIVSDKGLSRKDITTVGEATMNPDVGPILTQYAAFLAEIEEGLSPDSDPTSLAGHEALASLFPMPPSAPSKGRIETLMRFANELDGSVSGRMDSLRSGLLRLGRAMARVLAAASQNDVVSAPASASTPPPIDELALAIDTLSALFAGARLRFAGKNTDRFSASFARTVRLAVAGVKPHSHDESSAPESLPMAIAAAKEEVSILLPPVFAQVVGDVIATITQLPDTEERAEESMPQETSTLPAWVPARRTLGGFYILRAIGMGTGGTVFVAKRIEERNDPNAERFALKVPDYDGNAARSLTEAAFLQLFREEAVALLGLPHHRNLARFVTFDLSSRPKSILVMELVEGVSLERLIQTGGIDLDKALGLLDGVLDGLSAMHAMQLGHLDVKPSNVIVRASGDPVLVDFGLSGRQVRPGCGTGEYCAPEVWGEGGKDTSPMAADVYAFGCLAYEVLTSHTLFDAASEVALLSLHLSHDGLPGPLLAMADSELYADIAGWIGHCLRADPRDRPTTVELRAGLAELRRVHAGGRWPVFVPPITAGPHSLSLPPQ
jgi:eukaryotic-like serine/threonine-protein kinase